ncbi:MAG: hypothetical protein ACFCBV_10065 [Phycisphaerales bacterium]
MAVSLFDQTTANAPAMQGDRAVRAGAANEALGAWPGLLAA